MSHLVRSKAIRAMGEMTVPCVDVQSLPTTSSAVQNKGDKQEPHGSVVLLQTRHLKQREFALKSSTQSLEATSATGLSLMEISESSH